MYHEQSTKSCKGPWLWVVMNFYILWVINIIDTSAHHWVEIMPPYTWLLFS